MSYDSRKRLRLFRITTTETVLAVLMLVGFLTLLGVKFFATVPEQVSDTDVVFSQAVSEASATELVDINHADLVELMTLPGIGEARAQAILDYRTEHGAFAEADALLNVRGIGQATLDAIRERILCK